MILPLWYILHYPITSINHYYCYYYYDYYEILYSLMSFFLMKIEFVFLINELKMIHHYFISRNAYPPPLMCIFSFFNQISFISDCGITYV